MKCQGFSSHTRFTSDKSIQDRFCLQFPIMHILMKMSLNGVKPQAWAKGKGGSWRVLRSWDIREQSPLSCQILQSPQHIALRQGSVCTSMRRGPWNLIDLGSLPGSATASRQVTQLLQSSGSLSKRLRSFYLYSCKHKKQNAQLIMTKITKTLHSPHHRKPQGGGCTVDSVVQLCSNSVFFFF